MDKVIVSTIGTSLLTNQISNEDRKLFFSQTNIKEKSLLDPKFIQSYEILEQKIKGMLKTATLIELRKMSAELNALLALQEQHQDIFNTKSIHILITTDTWSGETTAELIKFWLIFKGVPQHQIEIKRIKNLNTDQLITYHQGASELVKWINEDFKFRYQSEFLYHTIFNLTGGFKILNGIMQIIAMLLKKEIVYIFEQSDALITVPPLPIQIQSQDWFKDYGLLARKIELEIQTDEEFRHLPSVYRFSEGDIKMLSEWGNLIWGMGKDQYYSESLLESPSDFIRYDPKFIDKVETKYQKIVGYRKINEQIDLLAKCLHSNYQFNPTRLEYRIYQSKRKQNAYLIDLSSEHDAARIILYKQEDNKHMIDDIISHKELDRS